jgi:hypothetical protein
MVNMEDSRLTRPYLESLSTDELVKLADSFGIDIPFDLERIFIIEELLHIAHGDEVVPEDDLGDRPDFTETTGLPRQYNISYIEVMIRDPLWAIIFWEVKVHDRDIYEKAPGFAGYCLRVIPLKTGAGTTDPPGNDFVLDRDKSFTVPVVVTDTAWYLGFPPAEGRYVVQLCALREGVETVLIVSRPFQMPRLLEPPARCIQQDPPKDSPAVYQDPLARLSGVGDFAVIRNADRLSRSKGNGAL